MELDPRHVQPVRMHDCVADSEHGEKTALNPTKQLIDSIYRDRVLRARQTPPEEKLLDGARLFDMSCRIMMDGIRHEHPDADEQRVKEMLIERVRLLRRLEEAR